ncbi:unnamed protein product [Sphagnum tenellum]
MGDMTASLIWAREQENLRLLKELDIAFNEVCDDLMYNFCFPSHAYNMMNTFRGLGLEAAEIRIGELRIENQHLEKTVNKVKRENCSHTNA